MYNYPPFQTCGFLSTVIGSALICYNARLIGPTFLIYFCEHTYSYFYTLLNNDVCSVCPWFFPLWQYSVMMFFIIVSSFAIQYFICIILCLASSWLYSLCLYILVLVLDAAISSEDSETSLDPCVVKFFVIYKFLVRF